MYVALGFAALVALVSGLYLSAYGRPAGAALLAVATLALAIH